MSFAFQGFGLGEFFKAQQRLTDILDAYFWGAFDVPSTFLSLGFTLENFSEEIDRLFDENSNPNSAILRSDNKLNVQQMLRVASHGVLDAVNELESLLRVTELGRGERETWCRDFFIALQLSELEHMVVVLRDRFAFHSWKLRFIFKVLRKSKIGQYIPILENSQRALGIALRQQLGVELYTGEGRAGGLPVRTDPQDFEGVTGSLCESHAFHIVQRFRDSCNLEGPESPWSLKAESTLLIILHWLHTTKIGVTQSGNLGQISVNTYINLIKSAWLLKVIYPEIEADAFSEETKTLLTMLSSEVIYMFRELDEQGIRCPDSVTLMKDGDYTIYVKGDAASGYFRPAPTSSVRHDLVASGPSQWQHRTDHQTYSLGQEFQHFSIIDESQSYRTKRAEQTGSKSICEPSYCNYPDPYTLPFGNHNHQSNMTHPTPSGPILPATSFSDLAGKTKSMIEDITSPHSGSPTQVTNPRNHINPKSLAKSLGNYPHGRSSGPDTLQPPSPIFDNNGGSLPSPRLEYSWNRKVNRQELGIWPGEIEIMPKDLPAINMLISYTGDLYGRWDSCSIRLFKNSTGSTVRMLAVKNELDASFDQKFLPIEETELVPEYGYHEHEPVICIRRTGEKSGENILFFKFQNAADMFNLQLAFLGESVEADFHAVRTLRIKRNNVESYQNASVQFWHEQEIDDIGLKDGACTLSATASTVRSNATVKIRTTRIVMYMYREKNLILLFVTDSIELEVRDSIRTVKIRSSSHNPFKNSSTIKAQILGTRDVSGGIPLNKVGLSVEDQDNFDDFKWFEFEFGTSEELNSFQQEFKRALNLRRRERKHADDLMRLAAQGVKR